MKKNSVLITAFGIATGLVSSAAVAGTDASAGITAYYQEVQDVILHGEKDKVVWGGLMGPHSQVSSDSTLVPADQISSFFPHLPAGPADPLVFLTDNSEIRKDVAYRPFEGAAVFAPAEFRDPRNVPLYALYPDDPLALLASRERSVPVITPAVIDRIAMYQAPADYLDREQHVEDPTGRLQLAALATAREAAIVAILPTLTEEERAALLRNSKTRFDFVGDYYRDSTQGVSLLNIDHASWGMIDDLSGTTADIATLKAQADQLIQTDAHNAFHLGVKTDIPTFECAFSPCIVHLTPSDVWDSAITQ